MQKLQLLKVTPENLNILRQLSIRTFFDTYAEYNTEENMRNYIAVEFSEEKVMSVIKNLYSDFYLALNNTEAIGYIKVNYAPSQTGVKDPASLELECMYVLKEHQGKKTGQFLLDAARDVAIANNLDYLWLAVWDKNHAKGFYAKNGFVAFDNQTFLPDNDEQLEILLKLSVK